MNEITKINHKMYGHRTAQYIMNKCRDIKYLPNEYEYIQNGSSTVCTGVVMLPVITHGDNSS